MVRFLLLAFLASSSLLAPCQFSAPTSLLQNDSPEPMQAIDIDGDGDLDLVRLDPVFGIVLYSNLDGAGNFAFGGVLAEEPATIAYWVLGDITGNGLPDLVAQRFGEPGPEQYLNSGGFFGAASPCVPVPGNPSTMDLADLTGDGLRDLVVGTYITDIGTYLYWMENTGGAFGPPQVVPIPLPGVGLPFIRSADLDLLGGNDLLVQDDQGNVIALRNIEGDASAWQADTVCAVADAPLLQLMQQPQLLDFDGDGDLDIGEASFPNVQWIENTLDEGGQWAGWRYHQLEAWDSAGPGAFGHLGCGEGASVVVFPLNPGADVRYAHWLDALGDFAFDNPMADLPRGQVPLLADLNGDGRDDLVLSFNNERLLFWNTIPTPSTTVELPELPALCKYGEAFALPSASPAAGHWSGQNVILDAFFRANVLADGFQPVAYAVYETAGCAVGAATEILIVEQPTISPTLSGVVCATEQPIQLSSVPPATEWVGCEPDGTIDPATFDDGVVMAIFTDSTGEVCAAETAPLVIWPSMPAQINPQGPFCVNEGPQLITAVSNGSADQIWSGDIAGSNSAGATFLPAQGAGTYTVVLTVEPNQPGHCEGFDTLVVSVSDVFPALSITPIGTLCATSAPVDLLPLSTPTGGTWAGPAVSSNGFDPVSAGPGNYVITYSYEAPEGCASAQAVPIEVLAEATVTVDAADLTFCTVDPPAQFTGYPAGGVWTAPITNNGLMDPAVVGPGDYPVVYNWTGADGCVLENATSTFYVLPTTTPVIEPTGILCTDGPPVELMGSLDGTWGGNVSGTGTSTWLDPSSLGAGTWVVTLTGNAPGECQGTGSLDVQIEICSGVIDAQLAELQAWPNPFTTGFSVRAGEASILQLELIDATGRLIQRSGPLAAKGLREMSLEGSAPGIYYLRAAFADGSANLLRLVKL
ncbi:MAG: T9SS type A sorting domain-containing protein [Flavobacteriales bacterium]|nr:T9SS type A sorting domain-containing protein [Flavobacteriales bacterium]